MRKFTDDLFEAVIVCREYSDFLAQTLPFTVQHFDRIAVITSLDDKATHDVCRAWSVECVKTDAFSDGGGPFNKGKAIQRGLMCLRRCGWLVQLDADIVLFPQMRNLLAKFALQRNCIYGVLRHSVRGFEAWSKARESLITRPVFSQEWFVGQADSEPEALVVSRRWGYAPIGFFQLWHSEFSEKHSLVYPSLATDSSGEDVSWALNWPRVDRRLLPVTVLHLLSEDGGFGTNWEGRVSGPFGYEKRYGH